MNTYASDTQKAGKSHPHRPTRLQTRHGESSEKVGFQCRGHPSMKVVTVTLRKWGAWFSSDEKKIARKVLSSVRVAMDWRLNVVEENCLQGGEGPVRRRRVLGDSTWFPVRWWAITKVEVGLEWRLGMRMKGRVEWVRPSTWSPSIIWKTTGRSNRLSAGRCSDNPVCWLGRSTF